MARLNGQIERAMQIMRKMANCLRSCAEGKILIRIMGNLQMYPWSLRYASFLINKFRILEKISKSRYKLAIIKDSSKGTDIIITKGLPCVLSSTRNQASKEEIRTIIKIIATGVAIKKTFHPAPKLKPQPTNPGLPTTASF